MDVTKVVVAFNLLQLCQGDEMDELCTECVVRESYRKNVSSEREGHIIEGWTLLVNIWNEIDNLATIRIELAMTENVGTFAWM